jgi:phage terminase small subunit
MARTLTKKQKGFVKDYVLTENGTQSALKNYDTKDYNTANVIAVENLQKPTIIEEIENVRKSVAEALTDELLLQVHLEGLKASSEIRDENGEVLLEKPDYAVRHKYLDSAYKIKGTYAPEKHASVVLNVDDNTKSKTKSAISRFLQRD